MPTTPMTRIGRTLIITGDITSDEDLVIDGQVHGFIHLPGASLTIGEHGRADAEIRAQQVLVQGEVHGGVGATQRIELAATARVTGSLSAIQIVLADGAHFAGGIDMGRRTIAARVAQYRAAAAEHV